MVKRRKAFHTVLNNSKNVSLFIACFATLKSEFFEEYRRVSFHEKPDYHLLVEQRRAKLFMSTGQLCMVVWILYERTGNRTAQEIVS